MKTMQQGQEIEVLWIFGNCEDDEALSRIYRAQQGQEIDYI